MTWQYKISLLLLAALALYGCTREDIDVDGLTNFAPSILPLSPTVDGSVVRGEFDLQLVFADGNTSPLTSASIVLSDSLGVELYTTNLTLSGIIDTVFIDGADFGGDTLGVGVYDLSITATDSEQQTTTQSFAFTISALAFPANLEALYIAGGFNGWSEDAAELTSTYAFTLVSANTWELRDIDVQGEAFKFKNTFDWSDEDWGDPDCDGIMNSSKGTGNGNTECGYSGASVIRFNDETFSYTVEPLVTLGSNLDGLYLLGEFSGVSNTLGGGPEYMFALEGDNTWRLEEVLLRAGDRFKFSEMANFGGDNFGDADFDGIAERFGPTIALPDTFPDAVYAVTFNDQTLAYSMDSVGPAGFRSIGILGSIIDGGFDGDDVDLLDDDGDGTFEVTLDLLDGEAKFRANDGWDVNWGSAEFPMGIGVQNGDNIPVPAGTYKISFTPETGAYNFEDASGPGFTTLGIIGTALPNGWDSDFDLLDEDNNGNTDGVYEAIVTLGDGALKIRADDDWILAWGGITFPSGTATTDGGDIISTPGLYKVSFTPETGELSFAPATVGIIGDATPTSWDSDTDLLFDAADPHTLTLNIVLGMGEVKFRANDDWPINWGGGTFPMGTAVLGGDNMAVTPGTYNLSFAPMTGEFNFAQ